MGFCDWRDCDSFASVSFWVHRPISEPSHKKKGPSQNQIQWSAEARQRYPQRNTMCRRHPGCDPATVTGSESPAPAAASKGFLSLQAGVPARSWPSASRRCLGSRHPYLFSLPPFRMLTACRPADADVDTATSCFCKAATSRGNGS